MRAPRNRPTSDWTDDHRWTNGVGEGLQFNDNANAVPSTLEG